MISFYRTAQPFKSVQAHRPLSCLQTREAVLLATRRKIEEMNRCTNVRRGTEEHRRMTAEEHRRTAEEWRKISPHGAAGVAAVEHMLSTTLEVE